MSRSIMWLCKRFVKNGLLEGFEVGGLLGLECLKRADFSKKRIGLPFGETLDLDCEQFALVLTCLTGNVHEDTLLLARRSVSEETRKLARSRVQVFFTTAER